MSDIDIDEFDDDLEFGPPDSETEEENPIDDETEIDDDDEEQFKDLLEAEAEEDDEDGGLLTKRALFQKPDPVITTEEDLRITVIRTNRITRNMLTIAECTRVLGVRATDLDEGAPPFVSIENLVDVKQIALRELYSRRMPLSIRRQVAPNKYEELDVNELALPKGFKDAFPIPEISTPAK